MNVLSIPAISSRKFTLINNSLVAEVSDLGPSFRNHALYADACDVGLAICSSVTNQVATFYLSDVEERDGDVVAWHYKALPETIRRLPVTVNLKVIVFND